jgi:hypothetical protein
MILTPNNDYFPKKIKLLVFVMERQCVSCEAGTEFLNIIYSNFMLQLYLFRQHNLLYSYTTRYALEVKRSNEPRLD